MLDIFSMSRSLIDYSVAGHKVVNPAELSQ